MADISIHCRFFARYAEVLERDRLELTVAAGTTVAQAILIVRERLAAARHMPEHPMAAVNRAHVPGRHVLADGDELALLPPLAGG